MAGLCAAASSKSAASRDPQQSLNASPVLVTTTMPGVFGCIPALDRFYRLGFGRATLDRVMLCKISDFYAVSNPLWTL
jgi:hypothetical protein